MKAVIFGMFLVLGALNAKAEIIDANCSLVSKVVDANLNLVVGEEMQFGFYTNLSAKDIKKFCMPLVNNQLFLDCQNISGATGAYLQVYVNITDSVTGLKSIKVIDDVHVGKKSKIVKYRNCDTFVYTP